MEEYSTIIPLALTAAFTAWAGVVAYGVKGIRSDLRQISDELKTESRKLNAYIIQTETRLAVLEEKTQR